jgi:hypothetical protein
MAEVRLETGIGASADDVWTFISDFGGSIEALGVPVETEGPEGVGQRRSISMGGDPTVERLESLDADERSLSYSIVSGPLPVRDYLATMQVAEDGDGRSTLTWVARFEPAGMPEDDSKNVVNMVLGGAISGMQSRFGA